MHIVAIAWIFVVLLATVAEATSTTGSLLGAFFTFLLYGLVPLSLVLYLMGAPLRRRANTRAEHRPDPLGSLSAPTSAANPDGGGVPTGAAVPPE